MTGTCFSKHVRSNCVFQARTVHGRETSCTSCKTSGRHSFWRLTSLALLAREHETRDRRAADHTDRGASHHSFIGDSPARSSYPTRISPPCPDGEQSEIEIRKREKRREKEGKKNNRELPTFRNSRALRLDSTPPRAISRLSLSHKSISIGHPRLGPEEIFQVLHQGAPKILIGRFYCFADNKVARRHGS